MYYYVLDGESWEVYHKTVFMSKTKYSREEFMNLIKKAYRMNSERICKKYDIIERCDYLITTYSLWEDDFNEIIEKISDLRVIRADEWIHVGLSITPNDNTWEIQNSLQSLDIPDCRSNCRIDTNYKKYHCVYKSGLDDG